jgi:histone H3/H4
VLAPVKQLIMEKLPKTARIHQHAKELISSLCMHFLMQLAEESNEFCSAQNKKTVCPDHVLDALTVTLSFNMSNHRQYGCPKSIISKLLCFTFRK